jgi:hypothetical protein
MVTKHYVNLSQGLRAILQYDLKDYRYIRIQSTWCEQKRWADVLMVLSDDFLMNVALGHECIVYDYGARKKVPRSVWQGLEWIKFVLYKIWYNKVYEVKGRLNKSTQQYFDEQYNLLSKKVKNKIKYYKKFTVGVIRIRSKTEVTFDEFPKIDLWSLK